MPQTHGKIYECVLFTGLAFIGLLLSMVWIYVDWEMGNICNLIKVTDVTPKETATDPETDESAKTAS
jgi:hypothetical protein